MTENSVSFIRHRRRLRTITSQCNEETVEKILSLLSFGGSRSGGYMVTLLGGRLKIGVLTATLKWRQIKWDFLRRFAHDINMGSPLWLLLLLLQHHIRLISQR